MPPSVHIYVADQYGRKCPTNASGRRVGYGLTAAQAVKSCEPWHNQAAHFRPRGRAVVLTDGAGDGDEVWGILGMQTGCESGAHAAAVRAAEGKHWSVALRFAVEAGLIAAPAHRPRLDPSAARVSRGFRVHPITLAKIDAEAKRAGVSAGQVIDRLADGL